MTDRLVVYLYSRVVGHLTDQGYGRIGFSYTPEWHEAWSAGRAHPISLSLPVSPQEVVLDATAYVAGLLPDSTRHRTLIASELGIDDDPSDFAFLRKLGRDSAGALTVLSEDASLERQDPPGVDWLDEAGLAEHLRSLPRRPLLIDEEQGVVLSLAGVNDKAAVVVRKGRIGLPLHGLATSHIIKVDIPGLTDSVKTEHFCLRLARAAGLRVPMTSLEQAEDQSFMLMQRYDRRINEHRRLVRVHQEDFCQALNVMPGKKYQRHGGPGWAECFGLMLHTVNPTEARAMLLREAAFQFLTGNPDAHAKNYSLVYREDGASISLSPIYDLNNAAAFRRFFKKAKPIMAMHIGSKNNRDEVEPADWADFAKECGLSYSAVSTALTGLAAQILEALPQVREECPDCEAIRVAEEDIRSRCSRWLTMEPAEDTPTPP